MPYLTAELRNPGGTLIGELGNVTTAGFQNPMNSQGAGSVVIPGDDPLGPDLLDIGNEIWYRYHGQRCWTQPIFRPAGRVLISESEELGEQWSVNGPGLAYELSRAKVRPYRGAVDNLPLAPQHRLYTFASPDFPNEGGWGFAYAGLRADEIDPYRYDTIEYHTIIGGIDDVIDIVPAAAPRDWVVGESRWIWGTPDTYILGRNYFRKVITISEETQYRIDVTADNFYTLYLDGQPLLGEQENHWCWKEVRRHTITLAPGTYQLAAVVENTGGPAGFQFAMWIPDAQGNLLSTIAISDDTWLCLAYPVSPPGWTAGQILIDVLAEMQALGMLTNWDFDFTGSTDSYGNPFATIETFSTPIGGSVADMISSLTEQGWIDWRVGAERELTVVIKNEAYVDSGVQILRTLDPETQTATAAEFVSSTEPVPQMLVKWGEGYLVVTNNDTVAQYGLYENFMTVDAGTREEVIRVVETELIRLSEPIWVVSVNQAPLGLDDSPYFGYLPGDLVEADDVASGTKLRRVMQIGMSIADQDEAEIALELEERRSVFRQQQESLIKGLGTGTLSDPVVRRPTGLSMTTGSSGSASSSVYGPANRPVINTPPIYSNQKIFLPEAVAYPEPSSGLAEFPPFSFGGLIRNQFADDMRTGVYLVGQAQTITSFAVTLSDLDTSGANTGPIFKCWKEGVTQYTSGRITVNEQTITGLSIAVAVGDRLWFTISDHGRGDAVNMTIIPRFDS